MGPKTRLDGLNHGHESHLLPTPDQRAIAVKIGIGLKGKAATVLHVATVVRGDPAIVSAKHEDDPSVCLECRKFIETLIESKRRLPRDQVALVRGTLDDGPIASVPVAMHIANPLERWEYPVLKIG